MSRRATLTRAAQWALRDDEDALVAEVPPAAADVQATLDDPALAEALERTAAFGRLSDGDIRAMRAGRRRAIATGAAAALVAAIGIGGWSQGWFAANPAAIAHYETRRGQLGEVRLADGSTLRLNGDTSIDVTIDAHQRLVALRRGEAFFDVAHEAGRPFIVHAGDSGVRVLGTAFDVDLGRGNVKLAVYRGRVQFGSFGSTDKGVVVPAGWRSRFSDGVARAPTRFDATQQDWRQDWLDTNDMRLEELVDALNRHGGPLVEPPPPELAGLAVSGRFKLDNSQQLLDAIGVAYGFDVVRDGDQLRLVPADSGDTEMSSR